ncbi:MAG: hypothetical protein M0Z71_12125 [Nitrospiraceae bacterium]|nr:hypothetical protein [Nitrospiraceae bacterium]
MKIRFDSFEVHPVKKVDGGDSPYDCFEQCEGNDPELHAWAVYGHVPEKGLECLADCPSKEKAELVKNSLEIACLKHGALVAAAKAVVNRWERGDLADAVRKLNSVLRCAGLSDDSSLLNNGETTSGGGK